MNSKDFKLSTNQIGKIKIITVGKIKDRAILEQINYFTKLITKECRFEIVEVKDGTIEEESKRIQEIISKDKQKEDCFIFALGEEGKQCTSREFSEKLKKVDKKIIFIIGGPFGMSQNIKQQASELFSLSKMTFTHEMCRLFLLEQIYRGITIIQNRKYHHD